MIEEWIESKIEAALRRQARSQEAAQWEKERQEFLEQRAREFFDLLDNGKPIPTDYFYGGGAVAKAPDLPPKKCPK